MLVRGTQVTCEIRSTVGSQPTAPDGGPTEEKRGGAGGVGAAESCRQDLSAGPSRGTSMRIVHCRSSDRPDTTPRSRSCCSTAYAAKTQYLALHWLLCSRVQTLQCIWQLRPNSLAPP